MTFTPTQETFNFVDADDWSFADLSDGTCPHLYSKQLDKSGPITEFFHDVNWQQLLKDNDDCASQASQSISITQSMLTTATAEQIDEHIALLETERKRRRTDGDSLPAGDSNENEREVAAKKDAEREAAKQDAERAAADAEKDAEREPAGKEDAERQAAPKKALKPKAAAKKAGEVTCEEEANAPTEQEIYMLAEATRKVLEEAKMKKWWLNKQKTYMKPTSDGALGIPEPIMVEPETIGAEPSASSGPVGKQGIGVQPETQGVETSSSSGSQAKDVDFVSVD